MYYSKRYFFIVGSIILFVFLFVTCTNKKNNEPSVSKRNGDSSLQYAGSVSCAKCHENIYHSHQLTTHYLTSQKADANTIKGSFQDGKNTFYYSPNIYVAAEKRNDKFYQVAYINGEEKFIKPFDISVGSGKRGQTFIYWDKNKLFQLPLTYFTPLDQWTNSPGYSNRVVYKRPITSRCLECHSTYFQKLEDDKSQVESFSTTNIVYGVNCEKCHGSGVQHVAYHTQNPNDKTSKYIINPKNFTRQQSLDLCRLCHGGRLNDTRPSFSYQPGDKLSDYFKLDSLAQNINEVDVHGNQYGMMAASKCFKMSNMTCNSCHSPHENETGKKEIFSQRCISCHNAEKNNQCKAIHSSDKILTKNCIDCHMPEQRSRAIMVLLQGEDVPTPAYMRSHYISIYKEESKKLLAKYSK